ncbi:MAG: sdhC [Bacillales bacterium]|jgi:succinate dehydrogenase / fumarate reductase cytochrome b subunit|nr:sdhC [Bacillales bacterium]
MGRELEFYNRKLHSLLGIIPIGLFLTEHLIVNYMATRGATSFNAAAQFLEKLPIRYALEIFIIALPLLYHAFYGIYIALTSKNNVKEYGYARNWLFYIQRISGFITLAFILVHMWQTRIAAMYGQEVDYTMMEAILVDPVWFVFYLVGLLATTYHFANGLWSFCISWGITVTPKSQKIMSYVAVLVFVLLSYFGIRALFAFVDPNLAYL